MKACNLIIWFITSIFLTFFLFPLYLFIYSFVFMYVCNVCMFYLFIYLFVVNKELLY